jgi:hypothetical protein
MRGYPWYSVPGNGGDAKGDGIARRGGAWGAAGFSVVVEAEDASSGANKEVVVGVVA